ncbi:hypothetical protein [Kitasatospora sp. NPDC057541]|uniref:hypothetical protein n=1 Tax=unclassified Kitasatospora TaxID=2633591 RepID=UPI0036B4261A
MQRDEDRLKAAFRLLVTDPVMTQRLLAHDGGPSAEAAGAIGLSDVPGAAVDAALGHLRAGTGAGPGGGDGAELTGAAALIAGCLAD